MTMIVPEAARIQEKRLVNRPCSAMKLDQCYKYHREHTCDVHHNIAGLQPLHTWSNKPVHSVVLTCEYTVAPLGIARLSDVYYTTIDVLQQTLMF